MALTHNAISTAAGRAQHVARRSFGGTDGQFFGVLAENGLDRLRFRDVALRRGGAVGVDVGNVRRIQPGRAQRHAHAAGRAFAARGGRGHMVRVGGVAVARHFGVNARAAGLGVLQFLQHHHAAAFAHDKSVAVAVERSRSVLGIVVAGAQGAHGAKAAQAQRNDGRFAAAGKHDFGVAHFDGAPGLAQGVGGRGAGRAGRQIRSAQIVDTWKKGPSPCSG